MKQWQHRKLTLIGKITVIKTFALPKLIYPFSVLPNPTKEVIQKIKQAIFNFIWDNKPDKVKRKLLIQNYENGGLKLTDIELFLNSIKASWIKRYCDEENKGNWKILWKRYLKRYGNELIFECNLDKTDIQSITKQNSFLCNVLESWIQIKNDRKEPEQIGKIIIWNNSKIKINNKTLFYQHWNEKGIKYLEHIYNYQTKSFYDFITLQRLYSIENTDFLKYHTLVACIPKEYADKIKQENIIVNANENFFFDNKENKIRYKIML